MKLGLLGTLLLISCLSFAQISAPLGNLLFEDTLSLDPLHEWISIPSPDENVWQIGRTYKSNVDSLSNASFIVTDTATSYPPLSDAYFLISIPEYEKYGEWPEAIISFYHRFQTDSLFDGGLIEVSYDGGESWKNICFDDGNIQNIFEGLYSTSDTISGGVPAFSGMSNGWIYTELHWVWIALLKNDNDISSNRPILRFRFISDSIDTNKDGWLINNIVFRGYDVSGEVATQFGNEIEIFPNPFRNLLQIETGETNVTTLFRIYSIYGELLIESEIINTTIENVSILPNGVYYYAFYNEKHIIKSGKLIKLE